MQKVEHAIPSEPEESHQYVFPGVGALMDMFAKDPSVSDLAASDDRLDGIHVTDLGDLTAREVRAEYLGRIVCHTEPSSPGADKFRLLRMGLRNLRNTGKLKTLLITSPVPQDGKTTVALNLSTVLADRGTKRVLLIDADLHRGSICKQLGIDVEAGLAECLAGAMNPRSAIRRVEPLGWYFLSPGRLRVANPTELLRPQDISILLQNISSDFDWIVVDAPPVLPLTDSLSLAHAIDGSLLVARAGRTPSKAIEDAIKLLGRKHIVGLVLNGLERTDQPYSGYSNYYREQDLPETDPATAANA
jgi:capsular exopolysaccharide synthesis family protein